MGPPPKAVDLANSVILLSLSKSNYCHPIYCKRICA